jgi:hypothetical protein
MSTLEHGKVTFQVRGPYIKWVRFHVDNRYSWTDRSRPFTMTVWLWQPDVFGPHLWGRHMVRANVRTRCGMVRLRKEVVNLDPLPWES